MFGMKTFGLGTMLSTLLGSAAANSPEVQQAIDPSATIVRTAKEGKAARNLAYLQSRGLISLPEDVYDRQLDIVAADEKRKDRNRDAAQIARYVAQKNPRRHPNPKAWSGKYKNGDTRGAFGRNMAPNDPRRKKTFGKKAA